MLAHNGRFRGGSRKRNKVDEMRTMKRVWCVQLTHLLRLLRLLHESIVLRARDLQRQSVKPCGISHKSVHAARGDMARLLEKLAWLLVSAALAQVVLNKMDVPDPNSDEVYFLEYNSLPYATHQTISWLTHGGPDVGKTMYSEDIIVAYKALYYDSSTDMDYPTHLCQVVTGEPDAGCFPLDVTELVERTGRYFVPYLIDTRTYANYCRFVPFFLQDGCMDLLFEHGSALRRSRTTGNHTSCSRWRRSVKASTKGMYGYWLEECVCEDDPQQLWLCDVKGLGIVDGVFECSQSRPRGCGAGSD